MLSEPVPLLEPVMNLASIIRLVSPKVDSLSSLLSAACANNYRK